MSSLNETFWIKIGRIVSVRTVRRAELETKQPQVMLGGQKHFIRQSYISRRNCNCKQVINVVVLEDYR